MGGPAAIQLLRLPCPLSPTRVLGLCWNVSTFSLCSVCVIPKLLGVGGGLPWPGIDSESLRLPLGFPTDPFGSDRRLLYVFQV